MLEALEETERFESTTRKYQTQRKFFESEVLTSNGASTSLQRPSHLLQRLSHSLPTVPLPPSNACCSASVTPSNSASSSCSSPATLTTNSHYLQTVKLNLSCASGAYEEFVGVMNKKLDRSSQGVSTMETALRKNEHEVPQSPQPEHT